jgi:hypothetical protein
MNGGHGMGVIFSGNFNSYPEELDCTPPANRMALACGRLAAIVVAISLAAPSSGALAQRAPQRAPDAALGRALGVPDSAPDVSFTDDQREGLRLFSQSCGVCHTVVQQRTRQYGPILSRETLGGDEDLIREYIGNGTPRMPGLRYYPYLL